MKMTNYDYIPNILDTSVGRLFNLYQWETPTRLFVYKEVRKRAVERDVALLLGTVDRALAHDRWLWGLENEWAGTARHVTWGPKMKTADRDAMNALTDLNTMMTQVWRKAPEEGELRAELERLETKMFPSGVAAIIKDSYIGKLAQLELIHDTLDDNDWLRQHRLGVEIDDYNTHFAVFRDTLETRKWSMNFKVIKEGRQEGHRYLCTVTGHIVGLFPAPDGPDAETRDYLLIPILDQNESMRKAAKERIRNSSANSGDAGQGNGSTGPNAGQGNGSAGPNAGQGNGSTGANAGQGNGSTGPNAGQGNGSTGPNAGQGNGSAGPNAGQGPGTPGSNAGSANDDAPGQGQATPATPVASGSTGGPAGSSSAPASGCVSETEAAAATVAPVKAQVTQAKVQAAEAKAEAAEAKAEAAEAKADAAEVKAEAANLTAETQTSNKVTAA